MSVVGFSSGVVYGITCSGTNVQVEKQATTPSDAAAITCAGVNKFFYIPRGAPTELYQWCSDTNKAEKVALMPGPIHKLVFHKNKVYCGSVGASCLYSFDPLSAVVETLQMHHEVANFEPAEHGFVFQDFSDAIFGFHFNLGVTKAVSLPKASILGHFKRRVLVLAPARGGVVAVDESAAVCDSEVSPVSSTFAATEDGYVEVDKTNSTLVVSSGEHSVLPRAVAESLTLLSIPTQEPEDCCTLCFCEFEGSDGLTLDCGHRFHADCIGQWVGRWDEFRSKGNHIVFTNAVCPGGCKNLMRHPLIEQSNDIGSLFRSVSAMKNQLLRTMDPTKTEDDLLYYICFRCKKPFYGGEKVCFRTQGSEPGKQPEDLLCEDCQHDFRCPQHGRSAVVYKCRYCCNPATHRSFGTRYLCERCNVRWTSGEPDALECPGVATCPLGGGHTTGSYPIGCLLCLPDSAIMVDKIVQAEKSTPEGSK